MLNLRRLTYFLTVLDAGTLTAASETLHVAQPALSRQVQLLEKELGLRLFERERGRLVPTPSGVAMGAIARTLVSQADLALRAAARLRAGEVTYLQCATTPVTGHALLAPFVASLTSDDPVITSREVSHLDVEETLLEGADFAITPVPPSPHLSAVELGRFPVYAVVSLDHRWARAHRQSITLVELVREQLVVPPTTSISRQELDRSLRRAGLALTDHLVCEVDSTTIALAISNRRVGVTTARAPGRAWNVAIVDDVSGVSGPMISLHMTWLPHHYAASTMESLARRLSLFLETLYASGG
ncbi:LysR family transcriptional regulator [Rhodococcus sp. T2V]|uniref:LysR family transcriptional regulator n=1 Tax=Rhodococcus sp. T2V TaxID=3034164 RepID=UPI0023E1508C|nr:LysR family transcriptional regulator [Rhodococcus sp. T2V]MDF3311451.1 LysR family transcriptional regulator [Rhodococcus sp. T2V]